MLSTVAPPLSDLLQNVETVTAYDLGQRGFLLKIGLNTVRAATRSRYMMTSPTFAKWRPRRETRGKVTSRLFARLEVSLPHATLRAVTLDNEKVGV